jgi:hypothetical protein
MRLPVLLAAASVVAVAVLPSTAGAASGVKPGYYAGLGSVPTPDVEFNVRAVDKVPNLVLFCEPTKKGQNDGIALHAPALTIKGGRITFNGNVRVTTGSTSATKNLGRAKLTLNLKHVTKPVVHYTYNSRRFHAKTAFTGTVSSSACKQVAKGHVKLFGEGILD